MTWMVTFLFEKVTGDILTEPPGIAQGTLCDEIMSRGLQNLKSSSLCKELQAAENRMRDDVVAC